jgi:hypothetical protein
VLGRPWSIATAIKESGSRPFQIDREEVAKRGIACERLDLVIVLKTRGDVLEEGPEVPRGRGGCGS